MGLNEQAIVQIRKSHQRVIDSLRGEVVRLQQLQGKLEPYLAKGVALNERTGLFCGTLTSNLSLVLVHGCLGNQPVPMVEVPVVAFLPRPPQRVYHELAMAE
jgi:hypothetical protein